MEISNEDKKIKTVDDMAEAFAMLIFTVLVETKPKKTSIKIKNKLNKKYEQDKK